MIVMMQQSIANMEQNMVEIEKKVTGMEEMTEMMMMHQVEQGRQLQLQNEQQHELLQFGAQQLKQRQLLQQLQHFVGYVEMKQRKQQQQQQELQEAQKSLQESVDSIWALCRAAAAREAAAAVHGKELLRRQEAAAKLQMDALTAAAARRPEVAAARQMEAEEITAETGPFRATAPGRAKAAARVAAAQVARSSSSSSSRNVYDAHLESAVAVAWWSGDTEEEAATEQPPELREL